MRIVTKFDLVLAAIVGISSLLNFVALDRPVGHSFQRRGIGSAR